MIVNNCKIVCTRSFHKIHHVSQTGNRGINRIHGRMMAMVIVVEGPKDISFAIFFSQLWLSIHLKPVVPKVWGRCVCVCVCLCVFMGLAKMMESVCVCVCVRVSV